MPVPTYLARPIEMPTIDNLDSSAWNFYQSLCLLGADFIIIRSDANSPEDFPDLQIRSLAIYPGPGRPQTEAGVSQATVTYFTGRVSVLGICVGLECLANVLGGEISYVRDLCHSNLSDTFPDVT